MNKLLGVFLMLSLIFGLMIVGCDDELSDTNDNSLLWPEEWTPGWSSLYSGAKRGEFLREDSTTYSIKGIVFSSLQSNIGILNFGLEGEFNIDFQTVSIKGKEIKIVVSDITFDDDSQFQVGQQYTLCTDWTLENDTLIFIGSDVPGIPGYSWNQR